MLTAAKQLTLAMLRGAAAVTHPGLDSVAARRRIAEALLAASDHPL